MSEDKEKCSQKNGLLLYGAFAFTNIFYFLKGFLKLHISFNYRTLWQTTYGKRRKSNNFQSKPYQEVWKLKYSLGFCEVHSYQSSEERSVLLSSWSFCRCFPPTHWIYDVLFIFHWSTVKLINIRWFNDQ